MADRRRKQVVSLVALLALLAAVLTWQFWPPATVTPSGAAASVRTAATPAGARSRSAGNGAAVVGPPPHVNLEALDARPAVPGPAERDPFRMRAVVPPPTPAVAPAAAPAPSAPGVGGPAGPAAPPPPPPISFKFIGTVVPSSSPAGKIAVLSDGKYVYYGREGDIIEGRYRLVKIGEESLQIEYVDGRGRQTLRLSGS
jgi:hypothetical protein